MRDAFSVVSTSITRADLRWPESGGRLRFSRKPVDERRLGQRDRLRQLARDVLSKASVERPIIQ